MRTELGKFKVGQIIQYRENVILLTEVKKCKEYNDKISMYFIRITDVDIDVEVDAFLLNSKITRIAKVIAEITPLWCRLNGRKDLLAHCD